MVYDTVNDAEEDNYLWKCRLQEHAIDKFLKFQIRLHSIPQNREKFDFGE